MDISTLEEDVTTRLPRNTGRLSPSDSHTLEERGLSLHHCDGRLPRTLSPRLCEIAD